MAITAQCGSCNKKFKANDKLAGKRVKCPQCGGAITIPATPPAESPGSMAGLLDEESVPAKPVAKPKPKPTQQPKAAAVGKCPSCSAEIAMGAVLCVNCGLDLRTGKPVEIGEAAAADASGGKKKKRKRRKKRGDTPQAVMFLRGCAVSFGFALVGSFAWWMAAYFWDVEFGIIAWVIGGLAGAGMAFGYGIEDILAGLAAAAVAFFAIFVAKVLVLVAILSNQAQLLQEEFADVEMEAAFEEKFQAAEAGDANMVSEDEMTMEDGADAESAGEDQVVADEGSKEGVQGGFSDEELSEEFGDGFEDSEIPDVAVGAIIGIATIIGGFVWMFWPPFNILFLLLACATAYQVGSGGSWAD